MNLHLLSHYGDGSRKVEYCTLCGAEGQDLLVQCSFIPIKIIDDDEKSIDTPSEQS